MLAYDQLAVGRIDPITGALAITGRAKDTIVLSNGENVEPEPVEERALESSFVDQVRVLSARAGAMCCPALSGKKERTSFGAM
jgi:long-subunit acyl-CoA synthetase (AMP-forming)